MPNYVTNKLTLSGKTDELDEFIEHNRSEDPDGWPLDFGRLVPMPSGLLDPVVSKGGFPSWYFWRVDNWGTKWNADSVTVDGGPADGSVTYSFLTAWSPPDPWLAVASRTFPKLRFRHEFVEEMLHFAGKADWLAGEIEEFESVEPEDLPWVEIVPWDEEVE